MDTQSRNQDALHRRLRETNNRTNHGSNTNSLNSVELGRLSRQHFERQSGTHTSTREIGISLEDADIFKEAITQNLRPEHRSIVSNTDLETLQQLLLEVSDYRQEYAKQIGQFGVSSTNRTMYEYFRQSENENLPLLYALLNGLS